MGRLSKEIEEQVHTFFQHKQGHLVTICEKDDADNSSMLLSEYCNNHCNNKCLASAPVISLGEVNPLLRNSELFAVGLLDIDNKKGCYIVNNIPDPTTIK